jgi:hypothetical protein
MTGCFDCSCGLEDVGRLLVVDLSPFISFFARLPMGVGSLTISVLPANYCECLC